MENQSNQTTVFTPLAEDAFLSLGAQQIAYVKAIDLASTVAPTQSASIRPMESRWRPSLRSRSRAGARFASTNSSAALVHRRSVMAVR